MRYRACIDVHLILCRGEEILLGPTDTIPALVTNVAALDWNDLAAVAATSDKLLNLHKD